MSSGRKRHRNLETDRMAILMFLLFSKEVTWVGERRGIDSRRHFQSRDD
jgi:hypothetical protein